MEVFKDTAYMEGVCTSFSILWRKFRKVNSEKQNDEDHEAKPVPNFYKLHYVA
jgi:hypothetical protein